MNPPLEAPAAARIHIFGASGSGTSSLGKALADAINGRHLDTDDYYWQQSDPPFLYKHPPAQRIAQIRKHTAGHSRWVLSGSLCSWGDPLLEQFTLAVYLHLPRRERMQRLQHRERQRYGARIQPGGDMVDVHQAFIAWAYSYDDASPPVRSAALHREWMHTLPCPVVSLTSLPAVEELTAAVLNHL